MDDVDSSGKNGTILSPGAYVNYGKKFMNSAFGYPTKPTTNMAKSPAQVGQQQPPTGNMVSDNVKNVARDLAMDIVHYVSQSKKMKLVNIPKYSRTMRRTVDELSQKHEILFNGMITKLQITRETTPEVFTNVADEIFADGKFNWGRIVSVYAFAGRLAKYCTDHDMSDYVDSIGHILGDYVAAEKLSLWIQNAGGWDAFEEYFPSPNSTEDKVWRGLLFTVVGLGALATMVAVK